jgi:hypothetical protein
MTLKNLIAISDSSVRCARGGTILLESSNIAESARCLVVRQYCIAINLPA